MLAEPVRRILDSFEIPYALVGAYAMAARGYPRSTVDIDFLTADERVGTSTTWVDLERAGATVDVRRGDADDPLGGVVHILLADGTDVDVVLAKWKWEAELIARAEWLRFNDTLIRVPRTGDLILMKLAAGGYLDLRDAAALLAVADRDTSIREVEAHLDDVRPDVRGAWRDLLTQSER